MTTSRRRLARTPLVAFVGLLSLAVAGGAVAATGEADPTGRINDITNEVGTLQFLYSSSGLPDGVGIDPGTVRVTFPGQEGASEVELPAVAEPLGGQPELARQTAVLVVDTSGSLGPDGMAAVRDAATAFVDAVPDPVEIGLVTFGDPAQLVEAPTTDHDLIRTEIAGLEAGGGTALYDATIQAVGLLPGSGIERLLVLTDGTDENASGAEAGSEASLEDAVAAVAGAEIGLTAVSFGDGASQEALQALADAGQGQVVDASAADELASAFEAVAENIATDLIVTAEVPEDLAGQRGNFVVTAQAGDATLRTAAFTTFAASAVAEPSAQPSEEAAGPAVPVDVPAVTLSAGSPVLYGSLIALFLALLVIAVVLVGLVRGRDPAERQRRRSLAVYSMRGRGGADPRLVERETQSTKLGDNAVARSAVELAGRVVERRDATARLAQTLDAADVPLRPGEWVVLHVAIAIGSGVLLLLVTAGNPFAMLAGLVLGGIGPRVYLSIRRGRRMTSFLRVLPDTLGLMASGLRAGYSMPQAMDSVAREGQEPLKSEFNRALVEARLGVPPEDAMQGIAERMNSQDFRWVVMAIRIQREVGGNLAELLDTVSTTLRERARLRRQVDVLSAEGRLSAWIVGALPVVFGLYMLVVRPDYIGTLFTDPLGIALLVLGVIVFVVGVLGLRWAVKVDV